MDKWLVAILLYLGFMIFFDAFYVFPTYDSQNALTSLLMPRETGAISAVRIFLSIFHVVLGIPLILLHLGSPNLAFGTGFWGNSACHSLVIYTLMVPYLSALWFFIPGKSGVPPAYRFFQALITVSGAKYIKRSLGNRGERFNQKAFEADSKNPRIDKYQALMEAEELEDVAALAATDAARMEKISAEHEAKLIADTDAMVTAEENALKNANAIEKTQANTDTLLLTDNLPNETYVLDRSLVAVKHPDPLPPPNPTKSKLAKNLSGASTTEAEAARITAKATALRKVTDVHRMRARKNAWEEEEK